MDGRSAVVVGDQETHCCWSRCFAGFVHCDTVVDDLFSPAKGLLKRRGASHLVLGSMPSPGHAGRAGVECSLLSKKQAAVLCLCVGGYHTGT